MATDFDPNVDVEPSTGGRVRAEAPADFTWTGITVDGAEFTRNPATRVGYTHGGTSRRPAPAHRSAAV